ncbi:Ribosomal protein S4e and RNA-binding S4 domain containing protein [Aphelenchoides fujianensis]|nr:Ribosomal protein S4e and RNA-binding S4 domain containing protein [Aphelenchoides fujianensis]
MARGPKHHLKRLNAPKHWMLAKLGGVFAPRPTSGPHKLRECLPLILFLRNRLRYALSYKEAMAICKQRLIKVDGKVRTEKRFPCGFQDVIHIDKTNEVFRMLYDTLGRFTVHRISKTEGDFKLAKVTKQYMSKGQVPVIVTHDARTIRYPDPNIKVNDTVVINITTGKVTDFVKFDAGNLCMVTAGRNIGRVGIVGHRERHPGSFDIVHVKDAAGHTFTTRLNNVFIIGKGETALISLPKEKGSGEGWKHADEAAGSWAKKRTNTSSDRRSWSRPSTVSVAHPSFAFTACSEHVTKQQFEKLFSKLRHQYRRLSYDLANVDLQSQEAFELASEGKIRPKVLGSPVLYDIRLLQFHSPWFQIRVTSVCENDYFLRALVHEIGCSLNSTARPTRIQRLRIGPFQREHALLDQYFQLATVLKNIKMCNRMVDHYLKQERGALVRSFPALFLQPSSLQMSTADADGMVDLVTEYGLDSAHLDEEREREIEAGAEEEEADALRVAWGRNYD